MERDQTRMLSPMEFNTTDNSEGMYREENSEVSNATKEDQNLAFILKKTFSQTEAASTSLICVSGSKKREVSEIEVQKLVSESMKNQRFILQTQFLDNNAI
ncbi:hypothetical protein AYI68_g1356 [Smittium mucronatum]|uniref:Uncharacterized protein n=1 Tax=Smittium mucronatum TaxID=133383 RepID=A0A1R0H5W1_9FUNG|nr:hypothetical protein AYI68_g1356 [Smittium mucronatum]